MFSLDRFDGFDSPAKSAGPKAGIVHRAVGFDVAELTLEQLAVNVEGDADHVGLLVALSMNES